MKMSRVVAAFALLFVLQACGTYSTSSSNDSPSAQQIVANRVHKIPDQIYLTQGDILDRSYTSLSDISVTVRKVTIFDSDPTQAAVDKALKEKAADMGADAVVFVRYGTVGISLMSWGELDGKGRAVVFQ